MKEEIENKENEGSQCQAVFNIQDKLVPVRGQLVLLDADVAAIYQVETKRINEAVKNNPEKFPEGYVFTLQSTEKQEVVENFDHLSSLKFSPIEPKAFTEKGLYMLATILKSKVATQATLQIVNTPCGGAVPPPVPKPPAAGKNNRSTDIRRTELPLRSGKRVSEYTDRRSVLLLRGGYPFSKSSVMQEWIEKVQGNPNHGFKNFKEARNWARQNIVGTLTSQQTNGKGAVRISSNSKVYTHEVTKIELLEGKSGTPLNTTADNVPPSNNSIHISKLLQGVIFSK